MSDSFTVNRKTMLDFKECVGTVSSWYRFSCIVFSTDFNP